MLGFVLKNRINVTAYGLMMLKKICNINFIDLSIFEVRIFVLEISYQSHAFQGFAFITNLEKILRSDFLPSDAPINLFSKPEAT